MALGEAYILHRREYFVPTVQLKNHLTVRYPILNILSSCLCFTHIISFYYYTMQYGRTALHAAYWTINDIIIKMLVNANANNLEDVQTVSHMLYFCTHLYVLCTESLFNLVYICSVGCDLHFIKYHLQYINIHIYSSKLKKCSNYQSMLFWVVRTFWQINFYKCSKVIGCLNFIYILIISILCKYMHILQFRREFCVNIKLWNFTFLYRTLYF